MDTFSATLALAPLAIYLLLLGVINLAGRPLVVNGTRETTALGLAVSGLAVVGPMQLFMPQGAAGQFGGFVWALLIGFCALCLVLVTMLSRPRLVVYNVSFDELRAILGELAARLDHDSAWAGRALSMPQLHIHLVVENFAPMRNVSLVATGSAQSVAGWRRLEASLRVALADVRTARTTQGFWLTVCGLLILLVLAARIADDPQTIARGLDRMLHP